MLLEPRVGHVHPVVPGDERGHGDDRGPARHLLHHLVLAVVPQAQVGLDQRGHEVAQRVGAFAHHQHVVVEVLVVGEQIGLHQLAVAAQEAAQRLPQRCHQAVEAGERAAHLEPLALLIRPDGRIAEDAVADLLVVVVEPADGVEVAVDDHVEQGVEQEADPDRHQLGRRVPTLQHRGHVEPVVRAHRDQPPPPDEGVDLGLHELGPLPVEVDRVGGEEQVGGVAVDLRALVGLQGVLDGQLVEAQLGGDLGEVVGRRMAVVDPDERARAFEMVRHRGHREALAIELAFPVAAGAHVAHAVSQARRRPEGHSPVGSVSSLPGRRRRRGGAR